MLERDLILRMVQDLRRLVARVLGLRARGQLAEAASEVEAASASLLGLDWRLVERLDAGLLATQLGASARASALATLCSTRAGLPGADEGALRRKAVELWLEAGAAGAELDETALRAILAQPEGTLGPRHEALRRALVGP